MRAASGDRDATSVAIPQLHDDALVTVSAGIDALTGERFVDVGDYRFTLKAVDELMVAILAYRTAVGAALIPFPGGVA